MGNLKAWAPSNPDQVKNLEKSLGLPVDGTWDPDLASKVESYQQILGQTPGQTRDDDGGNEYTQLIQMIQQRGQAFDTGGDSTPMQDSGFQMFLRNAGAQEADLLDEIQFRTDQTTRDINRHAVGAKAQRDETEAAYGNQETELDAQLQIGKKKIGQDYGNRGLVGASAAGNEVSELDAAGTLDRNSLLQKKAATLGQMDQDSMEYGASRRDALAAASRQIRGDVLSLYRQRGDEELKARDRIGLKSAQGNYPS